MAAGLLVLSLADKLSSSGVDVLVVESGGNLPSSYNQKLNEVTGDREPLKYGLGLAGRRAVGGTSHIWGGVTPRFRENDFNTRRDYNYGLDWPISFSELNRYYCPAGSWLRNRDSLCDREIESPFTASSIRLIHRLDALGISNSYPGSLSVTQEGHFEPINLARSVMPSLIRRKFFSLLTNTTVRRLETDAKGQIIGAICSRDGVLDQFITAKTVVLAGGAIQNARLLLLSKNSCFPDGIGNSNGNVGAYFMDHPNMQFWLKPNDEFLSLEQSNTYVNSYHYYDRMKKLGLGSALLRFACFNKEWKYNKGFKFYPESFGFASLEQRLMIGALCEQEPQRSNRISLNGKKLDRYGDPVADLTFKQSERDLQTIDYTRTRIKDLAENFSGSDYSVRPLRLSSHHLMGTTRMSKSDKMGVVDKNQKVYGTNNLYITGASVFSTGGAANPTLTLTALSLRLADHLRNVSK